MAKKIRRWLTPQRQLEEWQKGNNLCPNTNDECCPDFSCCVPALAQPQEVRDAFVNGDENKRAELCGIFLAALLAVEYGDSVHLAGMAGDESN